MIITSSRALSTKCWRKTLNLYHRNIEGSKAMSLVDGGAVHNALAHGLATRNWGEALDIAHDRFVEEVGQTDILPTDLQQIDDHWQMCRAVVELFAEKFKEEPYEVVQPECTFDVPIPDSHHYCIWLHHQELVDGEWIDKWEPPSPEKILQRRIRSPHSTPSEMNECACLTPHRIMGQTDAILLWMKNIWLHEVKTTSMLGDTFWQQWELDLQPVIYLYGIWKTLNIQPRGMIYSALRKPSNAQVANWNSKRKDGATIPAYLRLEYERRAILKTTEDVMRVEWVLRDLCDEWEGRILRGDFRPTLMRGVCNEYNRNCEFFTPCSCHEEPGSFAGLVARHERYDDEAISRTLVQIKEITQCSNPKPSE